MKPQPFDRQAALAGDRVLLANGDTALVVAYKPDAEEFSRLAGWHMNGMLMSWRDDGTFSNNSVSPYRIVGMAPKTTNLTIPEVTIELAEGEHYAGLILGKDGERGYHLILMAGEIDAAWRESMQWAASIGGSLPTRREQSLLYANLKENFKARWHWSCEEHKEYAHFAWVQHFGSGHQGYSGASSRLVDETCARAVRRVYGDAE